MRTIAGVVGVAIGAVDGQPVIKLLVVKKTPELEQKIPKLVSHWPIHSADNSCRAQAASSSGKGGTGVWL